MSYELGSVLSVHPSVLLSRGFLGALVFSETQHSVRGLCVVVRDGARLFLKWVKNGPKIGFFGFIGKFSDYFFLILVCKESSYYLLYSCTSPILGKNLVPEMLARMFLASQIAGFLN